MPGASPGSVELNWIAPGDDGNTGTAAQYMVRYNIVPITETITATNWISCTDVTGEPVPSPAGSNVRVSLCEHDDFYGICETFAVDDPYLGDNVHP